MDVFDRYTEYTNSSSRGTKRAACGEKSQRRKRNDDGQLKVVYISSPMKVTTCASRFRSLVQELTGKNSQVAMFMELRGGSVDDTSQLPVTSVSRSSEGVGMEGKLEQWGGSSDQSMSVAEEELGRFVIDENLMTGGGYGHELEFPWYLLME